MNNNNNKINYYYNYNSSYERSRIIDVRPNIARKNAVLLSNQLHCHSKSNPIFVKEACTAES